MNKMGGFPNVNPLDEAVTSYYNSGETDTGHTDLLVLFLTMVCESTRDLTIRSLIKKTKYITSSAKKRMRRWLLF